ncbi:MAG TPA: phosphatidylglycerol lysyltransferase domain-containing protein [Actinocrinis sp.]|nr:phosphatidylglycerol lysyltransferase domain-containing protein [Actinocrinis sp.]
MAGTTERSADRGGDSSAVGAARSPGVFGGRLRGPAAAYAAWYLRLTAWINLLGALFVSFGNTVHRHNSGDYFTPYLLTAGYASAAFTAFLAVTMGRRKRAAWIFNLILLTPTAALYVYAMYFPEFRAHAFNWFSVVVTVLLWLALLFGRREYYAKGDRNNPRLAAAVLLGGGALAVTVGALLVTVFGALGQSSVGDRVSYTLMRVASLSGDDNGPDGLVVAHWVGVIINLMSLALFLLILYALFRSPRGRWLHSPHDEERLRALLDKHGERDSLGYFALRRDKAVVFSPTGKAAVAYRVVVGVSLASGDPLGDPEAWPGAIDAWLTEAYQHAWTPAVAGASEEGGKIYERHGLTALELGDEAVVEVADFTLEGRAMRVVRQAYNRVKRGGYTVRIRRHADIPPDEFAALIKAADQWRYGQSERGFSMALGRMGDPADGRCVLVECHDFEGRLCALLSYVPWGTKGLSLDLMRRDKASDNGVIEYMVIELIQRAAEVGVERISLNFAMFRAVFERGSRLGAGPVLRLWRAVLLFFSRWWQIESLYRANAKYRPIWEPRFVLYRRSSDLPRIGVAYAHAEGFLGLPSISPHKRQPLP